MPESEKTKSPESSGAKKAKSAKGGNGAESSRSLSMRVDRSLKDVDRLMKKSPDAPPQEKAMAQIEQAKISALLELAEAIRNNKKGLGQAGT
jgi:hypothetical protein